MADIVGVGHLCALLPPGSQVEVVLEEAARQFPASMVEVVFEFAVAETSRVAAF